MSNYNLFDVLAEEDNRAAPGPKSKKVVDAPANKAKAEPALIEKEDHSRQGARRERGGRGGARGGRGGRPGRREFDRHSGSGLAHGPKRGDAGAYNWGAAGSELPEQQQAQAQGEQPEGEAPVAAEGEAKIEEEPEVGISVDQALKLLAAKKVEDDEKVNLRQAGEGEEDDGELQAFSRKADDDGIIGAKAVAQKKAAKAAKDVAKKVLDIELVAPAPQRRERPEGFRGEGRGEGRGRGGRGRGAGRGARGGRGGARGAHVNVNDKDAFPEL